MELGGTPVTSACLRSIVLSHFTVCVCEGYGRRCLFAVPQGRGKGKKIPFDSFFFLLFSHH